MTIISLTETEKAFIAAHLTDNVQQLVLQFGAGKELDIKKLAGQIAARQRLRDKLPTWVNRNDLIFPPTVPLEQASSEATARYKARLVAALTPDPAHLIDGTGGLGVDTWALAGVVRRVTYLERQPELAGLAAHNLPLLGRTNVRVRNELSDTILHQSEPADWLYLDPARRDERGGRVVRLDDCEPNVVAWWPLLQDKVKGVMLKTSPLIDIEATLRALPGIGAVHVVAVQHEVKEVLFVRNGEGPPPDAVTVTAVDLTAAREDTFTFRRGDERTVPIRFDQPRAFIYEPNAAILKAGAFRMVAHRYGLAKLAAHSHLYTSEAEVPDFPGRTFRLEAVCKPTRADLLPHVPELKANLTVRNFPQTVDELRKKLGLKEGGAVYLLATTLQNGDKRLLVTRK